MCAYVKMQRNTCFSQRKQIECRLYLYTYFIVRVHRSRRVENTDDDWPKCINEIERLSNGEPVLLYRSKRHFYR